MNLHTGKVVLITGAARGVGRAVATTFAREGADIIACDDGEAVPSTDGAVDDDLARTAELVASLGSRCKACRLDTRDQRSLDTAVLSGLDRFGHIDIAVANVGILHAQHFAEADERTWQTAIDLNLSSAWRTAKAVVPHMMQRRSGVFLSSAGSPAALQARRGLSSCAAATYGLMGLMRSLAMELSEYAIRVNMVLGAEPDPFLEDAPGAAGSSPVDGPRDPRTVALLRQGDPAPLDAIAEAVSWLASPGAAYITAAELVVDAGTFQLGDAGQRPHGSGLSGGHGSW